MSHPLSKKNLFPPPKQFKGLSGYLDLGGRKYIRLLQPCSERLTKSISRFISYNPVASRLTLGESGADETLVTINASSGPPDPEAYELKCSAQGISLKAKSESGIFYGLLTLQQIMEQSENYLSYFLIEDKPDFKHRGVMLDISRCKVPSMTGLFQLIDQFSQLKLNQLQLYTEHTFEFVKHSLVWANASPITARETLEIQNYCRDRFIELVPNLNSFGHFERWLRFPEYHQYAECPEGFIHPFSHKRIEFGSTLKPNRQSIKLLEELYDEYLPLFDSGYFNVGGDEPWELGQGWSKKKCEQLGSTNVYIDFMTDIRKQVAKRGKKMMFWSDIVLKEPNSLKKLSRDLIALNWGYEGTHPFKKECELVAKQKIPFYVCPGTSSWNSLTGRITNAKLNLASAAKNGLKFGAEGYLNTDWGDYGHHQYLPISYPGFLMGACHSWNHKNSVNLDLAIGVNTIFFRDPTGLASELLIELGQVLDLAPTKLRNATIFNRLLFWNMKHEPSVTAEIPDSQLELCKSALSDIRSRVETIKPQLDADQIRGELKNAIDMAIHGIHRLQYLRGAQLSREYLRDNLASIIDNHELLWRARNRPGGLRESADRLYQSLNWI